jgi:predicted Rossmann-fold nucleotide-binding protein
MLDPEKMVTEKTLKPDDLDLIKLIDDSNQVVEKILRYYKDTDQEAHAKIDA